MHSSFPYQHTLPQQHFVTFVSIWTVKLNLERKCPGLTDEDSRLFFCSDLSMSAKGLWMLFAKVSWPVSCFMLYFLGGGGSISAEDKNRINKMIKKAGSVIGLIPATLEATVEMRARSKLKLIPGYKNPPLHNVFKGLGSSFSERPAMPQCSTEQLRKFFVPAAVRNFNKRC